MQNNCFKCRKSPKGLFLLVYTLIAHLYKKKGDLKRFMISDRSPSSNLIKLNKLYYFTGFFPKGLTAALSTTSYFMPRSRITNVSFAL